MPQPLREDGDALYTHKYIDTLEYPHMSCYTTDYLVLAPDDRTPQLCYGQEKLVWFRGHLSLSAYDRFDEL